MKTPRNDSSSFWLYTLVPGRIVEYLKMFSERYTPLLMCICKLCAHNQSDRNWLQHYFLLEGPNVTSI